MVTVVSLGIDVGTLNNSSWRLVSSNRHASGKRVGGRIYLWYAL
jgi:hypothetical protein